MGIPVLATLGITIGLFAFLAFTHQPAEAASMTFTTDTTITTDQTIAAGETWTINSGVTLAIASGVTVTNSGTIDIKSSGFLFVGDGTIVNNPDGSIIISGTFGTSAGSFGVQNGGTITNNPGGVFHNSGFLNNTGTFDNSFGGTLRNTERIDNYGTINNAGTVDNMAFINNLGSINNGCGGIVNNEGTLIGNPINNVDCVYSLNLFEATNPSDGVIDLSQEATAKTQTNDVTVDDVTFRWIAPSSNIETEIVPLTLGSAENVFTPDEVGDWIVEADFNNGVIVRETLNVPFMVIPESPLGVLALVGSSLGVLVAYFKFRHSKSPTSKGF